MGLSARIDLFVGKQCIRAADQAARLLAPPAIAALEGPSSRRPVKADRKRPAAGRKEPSLTRQKISLGCEFVATGIGLGS